MKIKTYKGNTESIIVDVSNFDISGYTYYFILKENLDDDYIITSKSGYTTDEDTLIVNLTKEDTNISAKEYVFEIFVESPDELIRKTVIIDKLLIMHSLSHTI